MKKTIISILIVLISILVISMIIIFIRTINSSTDDISYSNKCIVKNNDQALSIIANDTNLDKSLFVLKEITNDYYLFTTDDNIKYFVYIDGCNTDIMETFSVTN